MKFCEQVIADFGGYDAAKKLTKTEGATMLHNIEALKQHLLNYRRIHNMYEAGDWVLTTNPDFSREPCQLVDDFGYDFKYKTKSGKWGYIVKSFLNKDIGAWRHATDTEIAQGYRS